MGSCRTAARPAKRVKGSFWIELILWLTFLVPGLIYSVWRLTSKEEICPECERPSMIPIDSPEAQRLLAHSA